MNKREALGIIPGLRQLIMPRNPEDSVWQRFPELNKIPKDRFPKNVLIIPDGNGRWANLHRLSISRGHQIGADVLIQNLRDISELGSFVPFVGAWGLSVDNLNRPREEIDFLMSLFENTVTRLSSELSERNSRFVHLGRKDVLEPYPTLQRTLNDIQDQTRKNTGQVVYIAIGFGGEDQELRIAEKIAKLARLDSGLKVTRELIESLRDGNGIIPPADLIIRTSERRLSDIGWLNGKQTESYFLDSKLFPDLRAGDLVKAFVDFSRRQRRFGKRDLSLG